VRLFIAIELPDHTKSEISALLESLGSALNDPHRALRWLKPSQFHLTLKFLGEAPEEALPNLQSALDQAAGRHIPFTLRLSGLGSFNQGPKLKVIWLGVEEGAAELSALAKELEEACEGAGFPREQRTYHPHLTLARAKMPFPVDAFEDGNRRGSWPAVGSVPVGALALIQSVLTPRGPIYTPIHESKLKSS
jgi:RNA 2',3'-cyclic 3'-phosphodiesterase